MATPTGFEEVGTPSRQDGVEIVRYQPRFQPGSRSERRARRIVRSLFGVSGAAAAGSVVAYLTVPSESATPVLGAAVALTLGTFGVALISWSKLLLPLELAVEQRRAAPTKPPGLRRLTRRPLLTGGLALGVVSLGIPFAARLLRNPHTPTDDRVPLSPSEYTGWHPALNDNQPIRLVREDGRPIRPADVSVGGMVTAFPGIPGGASNRYADSPTMLIRLRPEEAARLRENLYELNRDSMAGDFVAYSKICTHVGCPASLYEQQTNRLLCPCHQSQFLVTDNARPVFGPATRSLAMLPIAVDGDGYFVATSDFKVPVGPSYWER
jgi:ubiquinol-cytochrome c reductase iron-sulfur subunit